MKSKYKKIKAIPYQLCPKCNGDGNVFVSNYYGSPTSISVGLEICDVCNGAKIIPMYYEK